MLLLACDFFQSSSVSWFSDPMWLQFNSWLWKLASLNASKKKPQLLLPITIFFASLNNNTPPFLTPKLNLLSSNNNLHAKTRVHLILLRSPSLPSSSMIPGISNTSKNYWVLFKELALFKGNWHPEPIFSNKIENHNSQSSELQHAYMRSQQLLNKTRFVTIGWTCLLNSIEKIGIFQLFV